MTARNALRLMLALKAWLADTGSLLEVAYLMDVSPNNLTLMLQQAGIADPRAHPIEGQDPTLVFAAFTLIANSLISASRAARPPHRIS